MPYYCTVPQCTSMAGKSKSISFHQFPRDAELADQWNLILKRGKPYTKYSKVCSLHFTMDDYTIASIGKNKGQWKTLRKDAIPSQNLPSDSPPNRRSASGSLPSQPVKFQFQHQLAQAIYMQTMMAIHAANYIDKSPSNNEEEQDGADSTESQTPPEDHADPLALENTPAPDDNNADNTQTDWYRCTDCSKCFKDPDVLTIHKRSHKKHISPLLDSNKQTLSSNPILANLLRNGDHKSNSSNLTLAAHMQLLFRNLENLNNSSSKDTSDHNDDLNESSDSDRLVINESVSLTD